MKRIVSSSFFRGIKKPISSLSRSYPIFLFAFMFLVVVIIFLIVHYNDVATYGRSVNHSQEIRSAYQNLASGTKSAQILASELGKHHSIVLTEYLKGDISRVPRDIDSLKKLIGKDSERRVNLDTIVMLFQSQIQWMSKPEIKFSEDSLQSLNHVKGLITLQGRISRQIENESNHLREKIRDYENSEQLLNVLIMGISVISLVMFAGISVSNIVEINRRAGVESFLESVLNNSQNAIVVWESVRKDGVIVNFKAILVNDSVERNSPFTADDILGRLMSEVSPETGNRERFNIYAKVTETGKREAFVSSYQKGNVTRWMNASASKLGDGFIVTFADITSLKNSQAELQEKIELLEQSNSELEQFAYVASHDLQEPLRKIKTFASLINERFNEPSAAFAKVYLNKVIDSANRMSGLISDLLSLSYISDRGQLFSFVNLNEIVKSVLNDFELIIDEKKAEICFEDLPVVEAIPSQMNQLFYNLISNSLKYAKDDVRPIVTVSCSSVSPDELDKLSLPNITNYYRITIKDNGIGFDPQFAEKIFVIFQRLNNRQRFAGSGIGLALCKKIVLNHHGEIFADATENQGAVFEIILPQLQKPNVKAVG
ncbi:MAG: ATP-binding protein [Chitinophagaceae bacterium]